MNYKINIIFIALIIQSCFFSTSLFAEDLLTCDHSSYGGAIPAQNGYDSADSAGAAICSKMAAAEPPESTYNFFFVGVTGGNPDGTGSYNVDCNDYTLNGNVSCQIISCPAGQIYNPATFNCEVYTPPCQGSTDTQMASWFGAATGEVSVDGCNYATGPNVCGSDGFCTGTITGTGDESAPETIDATEVLATPEDTFELSETTDTTTSTQNTSEPTQTLGDGTTIDSSTTTETNVSPTNTTITYDGTTSIQSNKDGSTTTTTTVSETIVNPDGSSTNTETTNITHNTGSTTVTTTNVNTGEVTTSTTAGTNYGGQSVNTSNYDSSGSLTSQNGTSDSGTEEAEDEIDSESFGKTIPTDVQEVGESASKYFDRLNNAPIANAVSNISIPTGGTCPTGTIGGFLGTLTLDYHCVVIENNKTVLSLVMIAVWGLLGIKIVMSA